MRRFNLVIFDVDGTLVDTATDVHICLNMALEKMKLPTITVEMAKKAIGPGPKDFIKYILADRIDLAEEFHHVFRPLYLQHCADNAIPFDGIVELLQELRDRNIKMAVATNKARNSNNAVLTALQLDSYFDIILSRDDVENSKPSPDMLFKACDQLNIPPAKALMLGDTYNDIYAANAAGMKSCLALWGFSEDYQDLMAISTYAIENPLQILDIIESDILENA
ncbi:HAD-IA family hydrolase [candidate division KSB1 bacterium]|nr:HAD-IA family hydrolase [candidate division KSB1 bacterium]